LEIFERRRHGEILQQDELDELDLLRRQRELRSLDEADLRDLRDKKSRGEEIDGDLLHELELFELKRNGVALTDDELFELGMFERRRQGESLHEDELDELEVLKKIREEQALKDEELFQLRERKKNGELVDENFLYELELFHRKRIREELNDDELLELDLFKRRRDGEELQEDDLDELALLKRRRLEKLGFLIDEEVPDQEDDSVYLRELLKREQRGEKLNEDELYELDLLKRQKEGEELFEDELDELAILRRERQERNQMETSKEAADKVPHERDEQDEMRPRKKNAKKTKQNKAKKKKEKKPKEKKMRKKKKKIDDKTGGASVSATSAPDSQTASPQKVEPKPNPAHAAKPPILLSPMPAKKDDSKKGLFGGMFGRKNKKAEELLKARQAQEELIKEQLKALSMDDELEELEKEKDAQEKLVQEALEKKKAQEAEQEDSSSSWETDTDREESESESSEASSSESSESESDDDRSAEDGEVTIKDSVGLKSAHTGSDLSNEMRNQTAHSSTPSASSMQRNTSGHKLSPKSQATPPSKQTPVDKTSSHSGASNLPPLPEQIMTSDDQSPVPDLDAVSIVSDDLSAHCPIPDKPPVPRKALTRARSKPNSLRKPRAQTLSDHLKKQKKKLKGRKLNRHGDELSLGTVELKKKKKAALEAEAATTRVPDFGGQVEAPKPVRPWRSTVTGQRSHMLGSIAEGNGLGVLERMSDSQQKDFFADNQHVFDRSVFNFNQSFGFKEYGEGEGGDEDDSVHSAAMAKEQDVQSKGLDFQEEKKMMDSVATLNFDDQDYSFGLFSTEGIESKLADKLKDKEAEFDEAWATIEADKTVAAQMNQKRIMRGYRDRKTGKTQKKEEENEDIPRLFLFEGEKVDQKREDERRRKRRIEENKRNWITSYPKSSAKQCEIFLSRSRRKNTTKRLVKVRRR
jgi:hypothetical protein